MKKINKTDNNKDNNVPLLVDKFINQRMQISN